MGVRRGDDALRAELDAVPRAAAAGDRRPAGPLRGARGWEAPGTPGTPPTGEGSGDACEAAARPGSRSLSPWPLRRSPAARGNAGRFRSGAAGARRSQPVRVWAACSPARRAAGARAASGPYEGNAYAISQGERLYEQYNCAGCHFHGGGGIGPPLMDDEWIYGGSGQNIHDTIVQGRPNGMPSYGGHIPDDQVWKITAYVRTLSGRCRRPSAPTRSDELFPHPSEQAIRRARRRETQQASHPG